MEAADTQAAPHPENSFLDDLSWALRQAVLDGTTVVKYGRGDAIPCRGPRPYPGVVTDGLARVYITVPDGRQATLHYLGEGDGIGFARLFLSDLPGGLQAVTDTTILHFDAARFEQLLGSEPMLLRAVAAQLARYLRGSEAALEVFVSGNVRERVATHILRIATPDEGGRLVARVTQRGLADAAGSVRDVVARAIRDLRDEGMLLVLHGGLVVTDVDRLRRAAGRQR